ncbi:MAG TPA: tRNA glutamyl-Q(34) synthetase GluQRS [Rhizomicrobium sp.]
MIVTRFAPSPTGLLHLGHAFAAITACEAGERFLVRVEDIDAGRCKPEYEAALLDDLEWLGLGFERPVLRQSARLAAYRDALNILDARGLLYPCFCTRKEIVEEITRSAAAPHYFDSNAAARLGPDGPLYPGTCRGLDGNERARRIAGGAAYALRLDAAKAAREAGSLFFEEGGAGPNGETGRIEVQPLKFGDVVLARKETPAAYHLAVVVDDAFQGVTLVTRGNDLFASTHVQRVLQALLGLPAPAYAHHRLILDEAGRKFSKRDRAVTLRALREGGATPEEIRIRLRPRR